MRTLKNNIYMYGWAFTCALFLLLYAPGVVHAQKLENPLRFDTIAAFVEGLLQAIVVIALPIVGFFIVLSGFFFISARGNEEKLNKAKSNFFWVIVGSIFILGAWALAQLIAGTVDQLRA